MCKRKVVVSATQTAFHRMIKQALRDARNVLNNHEIFKPTECALAARIITQHGRNYA